MERMLVRMCAFHGLDPCEPPAFLSTSTASAILLLRTPCAAELSERARHFQNDLESAQLIDVHRRRSSSTCCSSTQLDDHREGRARRRLEKGGVHREGGALEVHLN